MQAYLNKNLYLRYKFCIRQFHYSELFAYKQHIKIIEGYKSKPINFKEEYELYKLKISNKEFIKILVDEKKLDNNYEELLKYNIKLFLSKIQFIIDKNKYNKFDINKYILDYNNYIENKNNNFYNVKLKHPYIKNYDLRNRCTYFI